MTPIKTTLNWPLKNVGSCDKKKERLFNLTPADAFQRVCTLCRKCKIPHPK